MAERPEDHVKCPSCLKINEDPFVLECNHSFCRACLQQHTDKGEKSCPTCGTVFNSMEIPENLTRNEPGIFPAGSATSEALCSLHKEELKLFCLDHQELVCIICRDAEKHEGHKFRPLEEVVGSHKERLQESLLRAKKRLEDYQHLRWNCLEQSTYIPVQKEKIVTEIKKAFEELRNVLNTEEEARLAAVRQEEKIKNERMKEKISALSREMTTLSDSIRHVEEHLASSSLSLMKTFQTTLSRIQKLPDKPELLGEALLGEAHHVGNLKVSVWVRMHEMVSYSPVVLDPNTAGPELSLSEDLTSVCFDEGRKQRPKNPERSTTGSVLGCELNDNKTTWDVDVVDNTDWLVGVRWGDPCMPVKNDYCYIGFSRNKYFQAGFQIGSWNPPEKIKRIRVNVDMNKRTISFSEALKNTEISKITNPPNWPGSQAKMYPAFYTHSKKPLKIIPVDVEDFYTLFE
ncbi:zinc-binding protein A33-like isoform X1 [Stigmatopora argus]